MEYLWIIFKGSSFTFVTKKLVSSIISDPEKQVKQSKLLVIHRKMEPTPHMNEIVEDIQVVDVPKRVFLTSRNRPPYLQKPREDLERGTQRSLGRIVMVTMEVIIMIVATVLMACGLSISSLRRKTLWSFPIWVWAIISLLTVAARHISYCIETILGLFIRWIFGSKKEIGYVLRGLQEAARLWMTTVFVISPWYALIAKKATKEPKEDLLKVIEVLTALLIISSVWFFKRIITMFCAAWFHVRNYQEWIEECFFHWYIVEVFSNHPWMLIRHIVNPKITSAWDMKRMLMEQKLFGLGMMFKNESEAENAAKRIFHKVSKQGSEFIELDDISQFVPRHDALKTLNLFTETYEDETIRISSSVFQQWMVHAFKHEKHLVMALKNMDAIASKVNVAVNLVVGIILAAMLLPLVGLVESKSLAFYNSTAFLATFFFGNMWKSTFDSLVIIFVEHPFDVGDRCEIDEVEMIVEEIQILSTNIVDLEQKKHRYTNLDLWSKTICNHERGLCTTWGDIYQEKMKKKEKED